MSAIRQLLSIAHPRSRRFALIFCGVFSLALVGWRWSSLRSQSAAEDQLAAAGVRLQRSENAIGRLLPAVLSRQLPARLTTSISHAELPRGTAGPELVHLCTHLRSLTSLHAAYCGLSDADVSRILRCRQLRALWLDGNHITDAGLMQLSQLPELDYLSIDCPGISWNGLEQLVSQTSNPRLCEGTALRRLAQTDGVTVHSSSTSWMPYGEFSAPQRLQISTTQDQPLTTRQLAPLRYLLRTREIHVLCNLEPDVYDLLATLPELTALTLKDHYLNGQTLGIVVERCPLQQLTIKSPRLGDSDLLQLGQLSQLTNLVVELRADVEGSGLQSLEQLKQLKRVELWFHLPTLSKQPAESRIAAKTQLGQILGHLPELQRCELAGPESQVVLQGLSSSTTLSHLSLHLNELDTASVDLMRTCRGLTHLNLFLKSTSPDVPSMLLQLPPLTAVQMTGPDVTQLNWRPFQRAFPLCKLTVTDVNP